MHRERTFARGRGRRMRRPYTGRGTGVVPDGWISDAELWWLGDEVEDCIDMGDRFLRRIFNAVVVA